MWLQQHLPFTVLKPNVAGKELKIDLDKVATTPTVYGIETMWLSAELFLEMPLQQHLPFTVLKLINNLTENKSEIIKLQQHLPFTVLKLIVNVTRY